jgi:hypothetical protein
MLVHDASHIPCQCLDVLKRIRNGQLLRDFAPELAHGVRFYVLGLAPNAIAAVLRQTAKERAEDERIEREERLRQEANERLRIYNENYQRKALRKRVLDDLRLSRAGRNSGSIPKP